MTPGLHRERTRSPESAVKKVLLVLAVLGVLAAAAVVLLAVRFGSPPDVDPSLYDALRDPVIRALPPQRVIEVEVRGRPEEASGRAIGLLYRTWRSLDLGPPRVAPRARWPVGDDTPEDLWVGRFALPVPDSVTSLPDPPTDDGLVPRLATWTWGEAAEILHVGPWDAEGPTVARLQRAVAERGYEIAGDHEEEYLTRPTAKVPKTIVRYPVRKKRRSK